MCISIARGAGILHVTRMNSCAEPPQDCTCLNAVIPGPKTIQSKYTLGLCGGACALHPHDPRPRHPLGRFRPFSGEFTRHRGGPRRNPHAHAQLRESLLRDSVRRSGRRWTGGPQIPAPPLAPFANEDAFIAHLCEYVTTFEVDAVYHDRRPEDRDAAHTLSNVLRQGSWRCACSDCPQTRLCSRMGT